MSAPHKTGGIRQPGTSVPESAQIKRVPQGRHTRNQPLKTFTKIGALVLLMAGIASAQTLTGTVTNGTTNKPAGGDDVILIKLAQGMEEASRTKADSKGGFSFKLPDDGPHLIRVVHQGVTYHKMAPPGTES